MGSQRGSRNRHFATGGKTNGRENAGQDDHNRSKACLATLSDNSSSDSEGEADPGARDQVEGDLSRAQHEVQNTRAQGAISVSRAIYSPIPDEIRGLVPNSVGATPSQGRHRSQQAIDASNFAQRWNESQAASMKGTDTNNELGSAVHGSDDRGNKVGAQASGFSPELRLLGASSSPISTGLFSIDLVNPQTKTGRTGATDTMELNTQAAKKASGSLSHIEGDLQSAQIQYSWNIPHEDTQSGTKPLLDLKQNSVVGPTSITLREESEPANSQPEKSTAEAGEMMQNRLPQAKPTSNDGETYPQTAQSELKPLVDMEQSSSLNPYTSTARLLPTGLSKKKEEEAKAWMKEDLSGKILGWADRMRAMNEELRGPVVAEKPSPRAKRQDSRSGKTKHPQDAITLDVVAPEDVDSSGSEYTPDS
ncbi:hypothetical protein DL95DRAFT_458265 [Leptodontidium sp. 2 PMI_412]|nr:hypothetical protein DL95DRAFT_458265 [Leptodontidium sp. 2 PMI_412]